jgi:hypothetical protein
VATPIKAALVRLAEAYDYARDMQCDLWDFAVEIDALVAVGLLPDDLRWLVTSGYVQHGREVTRHSDAARRFQPAGDLTFTKTTCFVLTEAGLRLTSAEHVASGLQRAA